MANPEEQVFRGDEGLSGDIYAAHSPETNPADDAGEREEAGRDSERLVDVDADDEGPQEGGYLRIGHK